jgi:hypothetical protein
MSIHILKKFGRGGLAFIINSDSLSYFKKIINLSEGDPYGKDVETGAELSDR